MLKLNHLILITIITLSSCTTEETDGQVTNDSDTSTENSESESFTGSWVLSTNVKRYDMSTDALIGESVVSTTLYILESETNIQMFTCEDYDNPQIAPALLQKVNDELVFSNAMVASFSITSFSELSRTYERQYNNEIIKYNETLSKSSPTIDLSRGSLQINGPVTSSSQDHVCLLQETALSPGQESQFVVMIPFDNRFLALDISVTQPLLVGSYQFDTNAINSPILYSFDVYSNSDIFWSTVGSNSLSPNLASLTISVSEPEYIEGSFSFMGQDNGSYTGEFNVTLY